MPGVRNRIIGLTGFLFFLPYLIAHFTPNTWWGMHHTAFLSPFWSSVLLLLAGSLMALSFSGRFFDLPEKIEVKKPQIIALIVLISIIWSVAFYQLPIANDYYGNARSFIPQLQDTVKTLPQDFWSTLFSFELKPGKGREGVMQLFTLCSYLFGLSYMEVFRWMGAVCGGGFILTWLLAVRTNLSNFRWQVALSLAGLFAPFLLIYFGHIDTYAPLYWLFLGWLLLLVHYVNTQRAWLIAPLVLMLLIGMRFHSLMYLLAPVLALAIFSVYGGDTGLWKRLSQLKGLLLWTYVPYFLIGLIVYFFVLEDYKDPRELKLYTADIERLFLPLVTPDPPLDKYNLLSWHHFFDLFNILFHWSPVALYLIGVVLLGYWKKLSARLTGFNLIVLAFLLIYSVLLAFNPLLSMPMDWDLFVFPTPIVMVLLLLLVKQIESGPLPKGIIAGSLGLALLAIPVVVVNSSLEALSYRMEAVGRHVYYTYYAHASQYLLYSIGMIPNNTELYMQRKQQLIHDLRPDAMPGVDEKFAELLLDDGFYKLNYLGEYEAAKMDFTDAIYYYPQSLQAHELLLQANLALKDYQVAYQDALLLMKAQYPNPSQALLYGIQTAFATHRYEQTQQWCDEYIANYGTHQVVTEIQQQLNALQHTP